MIHEHIAPDGTRWLIAMVPTTHRPLVIDSICHFGRPTLVCAEKSNHTESLAWIDLPPGNWSDPIEAGEMTEEQWNSIVRKVTLGYWLDYTKPNARHDYMCESPELSGKSLIRSLGIKQDQKPVLIKERK